VVLLEHGALLLVLLLNFVYFLVVTFGHLGARELKSALFFETFLVLFFELERELTNPQLCSFLQAFLLLLQFLLPGFDLLPQLLIFRFELVASGFRHYLLSHLDDDGNGFALARTFVNDLEL
jgi:hypothetical protein